VKPFPLPVVPAEQDRGVGSGAFDFATPFPAVGGFSLAALPEPEQASRLGPALALLRQLREALAAAGRCPNFDLAGLDGENRALVLQVLGEGEVSIAISEPRTEIRESVFPGVWRVRAWRGDGVVTEERVEVGAIPACVAAVAESGGMPGQWPPPPAGVMNAPAVLAEVAAFVRDATPHVINLSQMPMSPGDLAYLHLALGEGKVAIFSGGYGDCRIRSTSLRNLWRVGYFNPEGRLVLDTLEVASVPEVALAAREDREDSASRLAEVLEWFGG
jgi:hydrogenase-1 operon protein HyaF